MFALLNWLGGIIGILALMAGLAILPSLFGKEVADQRVLEIFEIVLSKNVLGFFSTGWGIGILVVATALFVWICLILSMSTHEFIVSLVNDLTLGDRDAEMLAWGIVLSIDIVLVGLFVFILFGGLFSIATFLIWSLMMLAMGILLLANYTHHRYA